MNTRTRPDTMPAEQVPLIRVEPMPLGAAGPAAHAASGTKVFHPWSPDQAAWLPASKREDRGDGHLAVCLRDLLPHRDLRLILAAYTEDRGQPPYDPRMRTVRLLSAYSQGVSSSRQIERRCGEDLAFMYLAADARPDHDTLCAFRRQHLAAFAGRFVETLRIAEAAGLLTLGRMAIDGSKIRANASKHRIGCCTRRRV